MASEEHDRMFDKALARHLRSAADGGEAVGVPGESASCPDAETLAAYHERALFSEQLNSLKEHIVGCAHCQTLLSSLEITDAIPLQAAEEEKVQAHAAAAPVSAAAQAETSGLEVRPFKSRRRAILFSGARWQWLAPAGAIAAGLLVWIAFHENRSLPLPSAKQSETKIAEYKATPPPVPSVREELPKPSAPVAKPPVALSRPQVTLSEPARAAESQAMTDAAKQSQVAGGTAGARTREALSEEELRNLKDRQSDTATAELAVRADLDTKSLHDAPQKKEATSADKEKLQAELTQLQQQNAQNYYNQNVTPSVSGPSPMNQVAPPAKAKTTASSSAPAPAPAAAPPATAPQAPSQVEVNGAVASYNDSSAANMKVARAVANPRFFSSPNSQSLWRVGRSGLIEFSKDSGATWSRQASGVTADLLSGVAPNDQVCWIVGKGGTILLTTDGGAHWKSVSSPLTEDLDHVRGGDSLHATIWTSHGMKRFSTSDGGLTWNPSPHP